MATKKPYEPPRLLVLTPCSVCMQVLDGIRRKHGALEAARSVRQVMKGCPSCQRAMPRHQGLLTYPTKVEA